MAQAVFVKQHYGALVATIVETPDTVVEVCQRAGGSFDLIIHNRRGESDHWDDLSAALKPEHFEALGSIAKIMRDAAAEQERDGLIAALAEIKSGLANTGSAPGEWMTQIRKPDAYRIACDALATISA